MTEPRCTATTRRGAPCPRAAGPSGLCSLHDPAALAERGRRGGQRRGEALRDARVARVEALSMETVADIRALIREALHLAAESSEPKSVRANTLLRAARVATQLLTNAELERELAELRALVERRLRSGPSRPRPPIGGPPS